MPALCYYKFINSDIYNSKLDSNERSVYMKKDYMTRLERVARWRLPPKEAYDVIADYREMVGDPPRPEEELLQDLGKPRDVIKPLVQPKQYHTWLAVFVVMAACIFIPGASPLPGGLYFVWFNLFYDIAVPGLTLCRLFLIAGTAVSLVWFRPRREEPRTPLPLSIPIALAVLLVFMGLVWWVSWQLTPYPHGVLTNPIWRLSVDFYWPMANYYEGGNLLALLLEWSAIPLIVLGIAALVKARTRDRRWRAVYILSLSAMMLAFCVLSMLTSMDISAPLVFPLQYSVEITLIGLVGAGVALC